MIQQARITEILDVDTWEYTVVYSAIEIGRAHV